MSRGGRKGEDTPGESKEGGKGREGGERSREGNAEEEAHNTPPLMRSFSSVGRLPTLCSSQVLQTRFGAVALVAYCPGTSIADSLGSFDCLRTLEF